MMSRLCLIVSALVYWTALPAVVALPSEFYSVELITCGSSDVSRPHSLAQQCISICHPIEEAKNCSKNAACTCTAAPPTVVQTCLQCLYANDPTMLSEDRRTLILSRLEAYVHLCGDAPSVQDPAEWHMHDASNESHILSLRERGIPSCLYGVPDMTTTSPAALLANKWIIWPLSGGFIIILLWLVDKRARPKH